MEVSASECVKVAVRCRPLSSNEREQGFEEIIYVEGAKNEVYIRDPENPTQKPKMFTFDFSFDKNSAQRIIFDKCAKPIVEFVIKGYNGTIFAYGQTGTGKTHTMQGGNNENDWGITPRCFRKIFDVIRASEKVQYLVSASMFELYNEEVNDLLNLEGKNLKIKENPDKGFYIQDLDTKMVKDEKELMRIMDLGNKNRKTSCTAMNERSSRSHCIFVVNIDSKTTTESGAECYTAGKLNLVDLAGSEKQKKTAITNQQQRAEAIKINLSLTTLRKCISELVKDGAGHISFRDSNLTKLLKDSLGGNTKTFMIANIGPASYNREESLSTLKYADGAKNIKNKPKINEDPKDTMIRKYNEEIENLRLQLATLSSGNTNGLDPKALMALLASGGGAQDNMGNLMEQRQLEIEKQKADMDSKKREIQELREQRIKNGENAERVEKELSQMEAEIIKKEVAIDEENHQKAKLLDDLKSMEEKVVVGDKEREQVEKKRVELESYRAKVQKEIENHDTLERIWKEKQDTKEKADRRLKEMQEDLSHIDKTINHKNLELTAIKAEIQNFEEIAAADKEKLLKEIAYLNSRATMFQRVIDALIPHSVEQVLTSLVEWDEKTQSWEMVKNQKIQPRYERPFSIHGLKKPTLTLPGTRCEYQNCFLKSSTRVGMEFWRDRMPDPDTILKGDLYLENQQMQSPLDALAVNDVNTEELDMLEKEIEDRQNREQEEMNRYNRPEGAEEDESGLMNGKGSKAKSSKTASTKDVPAKPQEELFPEAKGKKNKRF